MSRLTGQSTPEEEGYRSHAAASEGSAPAAAAASAQPAGQGDGTSGATSGPFGPYRGRWGASRPDRFAGLALPPARMPIRRGRRPLKQWRYAGIFGERLMVCVGAVAIGPARQSFWAVWDRTSGRLAQRTRRSRGGVRLSLAEPGRVRVRDSGVELDLLLEEDDGIETLCPHGGAYAWTRKQAGVRAHGTVVLDGLEHTLDAPAVIDDSAGYHARHTAWQWAAGVGHTADGRAAAWNLVAGINDPPQDSERTLWLDGIATETAPATFAEDLSGVSTADGGALRFSAEATRAHDENLLGLLRSSYSQPFGSFSGTLPGGIALAEGRGVMERHTVRW